MTWLRMIRCRSRTEKIRNEKTREDLGAEETVIEKIQRRKLTYFGQVERMEGKRLPHAALHGHVRGEGSRGIQRKRWMDNVREDLEERHIQLSTAYGETKNREVWRNIIRASSSASWRKRRKKKMNDFVNVEFLFKQVKIDRLNSKWTASLVIGVIGFSPDKWTPPFSALNIKKPSLLLH